MKVYLVFQEEDFLFPSGNHGTLDHAFKTRKAAREYINKRKEKKDGMVYWVKERELLK